MDLSGESQQSRFYRRNNVSDERLMATD
ncbi:hypothetical protein ELI_11655 [Erythrobacter litoralis HTCC2594]|uniref:Uncharacterized protein n=1 Tax=Erythrobacter litoralis (strain HTCC2594) TaxID=314225 RepID=Q2N7B8_ERYLH|nr:hypothetical protein ELI_11655 [Erythrobacter litoralis HTCC2594]